MPTGVDKVGVAFLIALALFFAFYFTGSDALLLVDLLVLIPLTFFVVIRTSRLVIRHSLWSLNSRLLCVYALFGVVPVLLLFVLVGLATWSFMSELAIYLAQSALNQRLAMAQEAVNAMRRYPPQQRHSAITEIDRAFQVYSPEFTIYVKDATGAYRCPASAPNFEVPAHWKDVHGLLVSNHRFYSWAHFVDSSEEITVLAPLSDQTISNLVPNLGVIALAETGTGKNDAIAAGSLNEDDPKVINPFGGKVPDPVNRLDIPVGFISSQSHYHLEKPGREHSLVLYVRSRPSAVLGTFFSQADSARGFVMDLVIGVGVLFFFVEIVALVIGISLSRRITRAVNQLYEGTQQVISGDFTHRIPIKAQDQLGELAGSFNQMTTHMQRLLVSEKERERLQAEIEIAREVQNQLYPQEEPPRRGLLLTARCDPARMVSGDYYDYQLVGRSKLAFAIGDVAGKGISAALLMATIQSGLRAQLSDTLPTSETECALTPEINVAALVAKLSKQIYEHTSPEKYATFFIGLYDETMHTLTYTNAGHLSPLLFRKNTVVPLDTNGMVIGILPGSKYNESCIIFEPGDLLLCYTDGITEPENAFGEEFGEERLIDLIKKHREADDHEIVRVIFEAVRGWTGVPELHDDMTLLLARQVGAS